MNIWYVVCSSGCMTKIFVDIHYVPQKVQIILKLNYFSIICLKVASFFQAIGKITYTTFKTDMEQQTGSKQEKEYVKAVYCHPAYLTYMQSTS